jgi:hypothetical protein
MPTTARSSTRVNADAGREGIKGLRDEGVKRATEGFWILDFELCRGEKVRMCKSSFALNVEGVVGLA